MEKNNGIWIGRDVLGDYYGSSKLKNIKRKKQPTVITKSFDNGMSVNLQYEESEFVEYEVNKEKTGMGSSMEYDLALAADDFVEYEIVGGGFEDEVAIAKQQSWEAEGEYHVESFEEETPVEKKQPVAEPYCPPPPTNSNTGEAPDPNKNIESNKNTAAYRAPETHQPKPGESNKKDTQQLSNDLSDDDFMADMKSILRGAGMYDPASKKIVDKNQKARQESEVHRVAKEQSIEEQPILPLEQKNEHQIFERIAQSMKYANAYDLGSISLEKRFEDFDKFADVEPSPKKTDNFRNTGSRSASTAKPDIVDTADFIRDLDQIKQPQPNHSSGADALKKTPDTVPLDPGVDGRSINLKSLSPGDLILSSTQDRQAKIVGGISGVDVSHAAIYIGDGKLIEAMEEGVLEQVLETTMMHDSVTVAYRHKAMTPEKAQLVVGFLKDAKNNRRKFDYHGLVKVVPSQLMANYCDSLPQASRDSCKTNSQRLRLGVDTNNEFYCSELVFAALKHAGLQLSDVDPTWSSPQNFVRLNHNGTLSYIGHLKS